MSGHFGMRIGLQIFQNKYIFLLSSDMLVFKSPKKYLTQKKHFCEIVFSRHCIANILTSSQF